MLTLNVPSVGVGVNKAFLDMDIDAIRARCALGTL